MLHHRRRLLLALTPLLVIALVAALLALRLATVNPDQPRAAYIASGGRGVEVSAVAATANPVPRGVAGVGDHPLGKVHGRC